MNAIDDPRSFSDAELVAAIAARDGAAFAVFYRRHLSAVLSYLLRQAGDRELAADLGAEVFAAVLLAAGRYRPDGESALPWVLGIARRKWLESLRRGRIEARARRRLGMEPVLLDDVDLLRVERLADVGGSKIDALLLSLPAAERQAILAHVVDERGYGEIAAELRCSEMVIRKRVSRGLARLRDGIGEGMSGVERA
jgi:RNA polymerase sigma-70 factor (ECF subfamily)